MRDSINNTDGISRELRRKQNMKRRKISLFVLTLIILAAVATLLFFLFGNNENHSNAGQSNQNYSDIYYYESNNSERYEQYSENNPKLSKEEVIWHVNSGLDGDFYKDIKEYKDKNDLNDVLIIVNKYNKLPSSFNPENLEDAGKGIQLRKEASEAYKKMEGDASKENINFIPQSGYRSYDYQNTLYENYKKDDPKGADTYSARPGFSEHQTGLALDINIPSGGSLRNFNGTKQAEWVSQNAHKYGFIIRYTEENKDITGYMSEPWHIRYIGVDHATKMFERSISSYEEYRVKFIDHKPK